MPSVELFLGDLLLHAGRFQVLKKVNELIAMLTQSIKRPSGAFR
ncbi:hypothetical protein SC1_00766 [Sphingopyxis sp. C-1]|nr:hypothetical protein SC1_00766 [Sphingopyxis sp. C-1]